MNTAEQRQKIKKSMWESCYAGLAGIAILIYSINNLITLSKDSYFFKTYSVPKILGWFFDIFGPIPTTVLMIILGSVLFIYFIFKIVSGKKKLNALKNTPDETSVTE